MTNGKVLPILVIFSISVMMIFSVLPANAHEGTTHSPAGVCPGGNPGPFELLLLDHLTEFDFSQKDRNGNGWVCLKITNGGNPVVVDDRILKTKN